MPSAPDDHDTIDREAILARRALFVSSALAALSCHPGSPPARPEPDDTAALPHLPELSRDPKSDDFHASNGAARSPGHSHLEQLEPWSDLVPSIPPLDVPPGLPAIDAVPLTAEALHAASLVDRLRQLWTSVPRLCALSGAECHAAWLEFARESATLSVDVLRMMPRCGFDRSTRTTTAQRLRAHQRFLLDTLERLQGEARFDHAAQEVELSRGNTYAALEAAVAVPMPCLMCFSAADFDVIELTITFEPSSTRLSARGETTLGGLVDQLAANGGLRLEVRGHGDPSEGAAAEALAIARAQVVVARLVELGVARERLDTSAFGARLPVDHPGGEANRRVDFELVSR